MTIAFPSDIKKFEFASKTNQVSDYVDTITSAIAGISEDVKMEMALCLTEALNNAIIHGNFAMSSEIKNEGLDGFDKFHQQIEVCEQDPVLNQKIVTVMVAVYADIATIIVQDEGKGFDHTQITSITDAMHFSGNGINMMKMFADTVEFNQTGNAVTFTKNLSQISAQEDKTAIAESDKLLAA